jgi:charged multivesicular body protein 5
MKRLFGVKKTVEAPSLEETTGKLDARAQSIDQKIKLIDQQLAKSRDQIKKIRPGPSQDAVKKRALIILKQKKMYEHQRDQLYSQQYNVDSVAFATENAKATVDTVRAMKAASKELKTQFKQKEFDIDKIDSLNDQMADLLEYNEEVQEVLGQSYATPEDIDEDGLMDELDALELDLEEDLENEIGNGEIPSYLRDDPLPAAPEEKPLGAMPNAPSEKVPEAPANATNAGEAQKETAEKV